MTVVYRVPKLGDTLGWAGGHLPLEGSILWRTPPPTQCGLAWLPLFAGLVALVVPEGPCTSYFPFPWNGARSSWAQRGGYVAIGVKGAKNRN